MPTLAQARDEKLLQGIIEHKYLRADQAAELFFKNIKDPLQRRQKAATRLLSLHKKKRVQRFRYPGEPYIYTTSGTRYSPKILHYLAVTDVLIHIINSKVSSVVLTPRLEHRQSSCITDLYILCYEPFKSLKTNLYIEVELNNSQDIVEKIEKYEDILQDVENARLIVVCKHKRTIDRIKAHDFDVPVEAYDLKYFAEQFKL